MNPQTYKDNLNNSAIPNFFLDSKSKDNSAPSPRNGSELTRPNLQVVSRKPAPAIIPHNLPLVATTIVGRERETAEIAALLRSDLSLVTLTGTAGTGKTRLALQVAHELLNEFQDGTFFISLTAFTDPAQVVPTIARILGINEGGRPMLDMLKEWVSTRQALLFIDNFEQVVSAAPLLTELLSVAPGLKILVTSREVLRVYGEREYPLTPLSLPDVKDLPSLQQLAENGAVSLFVQRARSVKPDFALTEANAQAVTEICARLDGLPLAIELAAARSKLFTPQALLARLSNTLDLLVSNMRDTPLRQQKLRSAFDWSYDFLEPAEKRLFTWLAVFVKGSTLEAAEAVFSGINHPEIEDYAILDILSSLVDKSMLQLVNGKNGEPRFLMLETLRDYARERLTGAAEEQILRLRHAEYFLDLAEKAEPALIGPDQTGWVERLNLEYANFQAALAWLLENNQAVQFTGEGAQPGVPTHFLEMAARMVGSLARLWHIRNQTSESRRGFEQVLAKITDRTSLPLPIMHKILSGAGSMAYIQGDYPAALAWYQEALDLNKASGDKLGTARVLRDMGLVMVYAGNWQEALAIFEEAIVVQEKLDDRWGLGVTLLNRGLAGLGADNLELSQESLDTAYKIFTDVKEVRGSSYALNNLGYVALLRGDLAKATGLLLESIHLKQTFNDRLGIAWSLDGLAAILARQGQLEKATYFLSAANKLRDLVCSPLTHLGHKLNAPVIALVREGLDEATYRRELTRGYHQSLEEMLAEAYALESGIEDRRSEKKAAARFSLASQVAHSAPPEEDASNSRPSSLKLIDTLTSREIEVLRTVALGLSNQQVAEKLVIAPRTVNVHLTSIYGKLGVTSRTEATRFAFENNLV